MSELVNDESVSNTSSRLDTIVTECSNTICCTSNGKQLYFVGRDSKEEEVDVVDVIDDDDKNDNDDYFADVGFMFERNQPVKLLQYEWQLDSIVSEVPLDVVQEQNNSSTNSPSNNNNNRKEEDSTKKTIRVAIHAADDSPGAVQSGHYLWPAAKLLADFLVKEFNNHCCTCQRNRRSNIHNNINININIQDSDLPSSCLYSTVYDLDSDGEMVVNGIIELGAGCGLVSLVAMQLFNSTGQLQCVTLTDHDPGVLVRARDNHETTLQCIVDHIEATARNNNNNNNSSSSSEYYLNAFINTTASIPVLFEPLEWGDTATVDIIYSQMMEHIVGSSSSFGSHINSNSKESLAVMAGVTKNNWLLLGSDLIYCADVVRPLFQTVSRFMSLILHHQQQQQHRNTAAPLNARFLLSQSFAYDECTENQIHDACQEFNLKRTIALDSSSTPNNENTFQRVQEFVPILTGT